MFKDSNTIRAVETAVLETGKKEPRLNSVDLARGIVMILMALDHVRDYFTNVRFNPLDLTQTSPELFMTRWITHLCAPAFVFLAGTGSFLSTRRGKTKKELSVFLLTRGLWLIFLELTLVRFGWVFNFDYSFSLGQVIWAIGWSMIALAGLIHFSIKTISIVGISMILVHNLFDKVTPQQAGIFGWTWQILHYGGSIVYTPGYHFEAAYPLIPWIGVMAAGYSFGAILFKEEKKRRKILTLIGGGLIIFFFLLRLSNIYGDSNIWKEQKDFIFTFFSFINVEKYPPSLLFLAITLGITILALPLLEKAKGTAAKFFITFGRVPMFYYLLHIPLIHGLAVITAIIIGEEFSFMFTNTPPWIWPEGWGFNLPAVYAFWMGIVLLLYPLCVWFGNVKNRHRENKWLSYL
jgi:uncharacterized membrane protein